MNRYKANRDAWMHFGAAFAALTIEKGNMNEPFKLDIKPANDRGFLRADFKDRNGEACSIQESSLQFVEEDEGPCLWLGQNEGTHHMGKCLARMHLSREMCAELARALMRFAETGSLEE